MCFSHHAVSLVKKEKIDDIVNGCSQVINEVNNEEGDLFVGWNLFCLVHQKTFSGDEYRE